MSIIDSMLQRFGYTKAERPKYPQWVRDTAEVQRYDIPDGSIYANQADLYARLSWVNIATSVPSGIAATTQINVKRVRGEKETDVPNHPFELLLERPNPNQSQFELMRSTVLFWLLNANSFWWLNTDNESKPPSEIWCIPPSRITPVPDGNMFLAGYDYDPGNGQLIRLPPWQVVHFHDFHPNSMYAGLSKVESIALDAAADIAASRWNAKLYGENNGRLPGIIAFADMILDPDWKTIKNDIESAARNRNHMLLRGAGKGGVEWMRSAETIRDMEFTQGRTFTKEEIYSIFAPGLASILAINATEANSKTGKATLIEFCVWPLLVAMCQKITAQIMPLYNTPQLTFRVEPEDIRVVDRALILAERAAYERTHTVDEVREKYDGDKPIAQITGIESDRRGLALPAQITAATPIPSDEEEEPEPMPQPIAPPMVTEPQEQPEEPGDEMDEEEQEEVSEEQQDLAKWKRKALNALDRGKSPAVKFQSDAISAETFERIAAGLSACKSAQDVRAVFRYERQQQPRADIMALANAINNAAEATKAAPVQIQQAPNPITVNLTAQMPQPGEQPITINVPPAQVVNEITVQPAENVNQVTLPPMTVENNITAQPGEVTVNLPEPPPVDVVRDSKGKVSGLRPR